MSTVRVEIRSENPFRSSVAAHQMNYTLARDAPAHRPSFDLPTDPFDPLDPSPTFSEFDVKYPHSPPATSALFSPPPVRHNLRGVRGGFRPWPFKIWFEILLVGLMLALAMAMEVLLALSVKYQGFSNPLNAESG